MITKSDIQRINKESGLPLLQNMIRYKSYLQRAILPMLTIEEQLSIKNSIYNDSVTRKLVSLASVEYNKNKNEQTLFALAMCVGTILKEYEWGVKYVLPDGLCEIANRIETI